MFSKISLFAVLLSVFALMGSAADSLLVRSGDKILFLGDSITQFGNRRDGFVHLTMDGLKKSGLKNLSYIPGGVSGNRTTQVVKRLGALLKKKPQWVILQIGVNDVNWGARGGVALPQYKKNIALILDQCAKAGAKVLIVTPTLCREKLSFANNKTLETYCAFLREEAARRKLPVADWNKVMQSLLRSGKIKGDKARILTIDGLHLNGYGNIHLARTILQALKLPAKNLDSLERSWRKIPSMAPILNSWGSPHVKISVEDFEVLYKAASAKKLPVKKYTEQLIYNHIRDLKKRK